MLYPQTGYEFTYNSDVPSSRQTFTQSSKSTQGSDPSPQLECDESLDLFPTLDLPDDLLSEEHVHYPQDLITDISQVVTCLEPVSPVMVEGWCDKHLQYMYSLLEKEIEYSCNPFSLQLLQPSISPMMRAVLLDWMMEVCGEFLLKRETYYLACNYVDRVISLKSGLRRDEFQLLGLAAMVIASKVEEICSPKLTDFAKSADSGFSLGQIKVMEKTILKTLSWRVFPPTVYNWVNLSMTLWDDFLTNSLLDVDQPEASLILFKQSTQTSYRRFRESLQVLDAAYLDVDVLRYSSRHLVAGLLYLMISKYFYETEYALLASISSVQSFEADSLSLCYGDGVGSGDQPQQAQVVQMLFSEFARTAMEIRSVEDIYPTVAFLNSYLEFDAPFDLPVACKFLPKAKLESHYEDFLAYQTHNDSNLSFISPRLRQCSA